MLKIMVNKWEYHLGFKFVDKWYITWIKPTKFDKDGVMKFEYKSEESTEEKIKEIADNSNVFYQYQEK